MMREGKCGSKRRSSPVSYLRHISDKTCNVKTSPNKPLQLTAYSVRCAAAFGSS